MRTAHSETDFTEDLKTFDVLKATLQDQANADLLAFLLEPARLPPATQLA